MPTGYTAPIADGITFEQFAFGCARAFGALVTMRDDPSDAPIPEHFAPSDHHQKRLEETHAEMDQIKAMTGAQLTECAMADHRAELNRYHEYIAKENALRGKYEAMLEKVNAWVPPTSEHSALKDFMAEQIKQSIQFDCSPTSTYWQEQIAALAEQTPDEWKAKRLGKLYRDLEYHETEHRKEVERAASRTAWVKALRESLGA
jgi:hypothetical protein